MNEIIKVIHMKKQFPHGTTFPAGSASGMKKFQFRHFRGDSGGGIIEALVGRSLGNCRAHGHGLDPDHTGGGRGRGCLLQDSLGRGFGGLSKLVDLEDPA